MSPRVFFFATLLICGLSFKFMNFRAAGGFQHTFLPFLFSITLLACFVVALGWLILLVQRLRRDSLGGRRSRSGGGGSASAGGDWPTSWGADFGGSGDCGGGGGGGGD